VLATFTPSAAREARKAPLLWRVEKNGKVSYLFGTVHVGLDLETSLQPAGMAALDGARRVFVELDLTSFDVLIDLLRQTWARAEMPPGRSLRALVTPRTWDRLTTLYKGRLPPEVIDRMEPWFATLATVPLVAAKRKGKQPEIARGRPPLDAAIAARAKGRKIPVSELDTTLQQIQAISSAGRDEGVAMLEELLADPDSQRHDFDGLIGAYVAEDDRRMLKAYGHLLRRKPAIAKELLFRRNERWCERLQLWLVDGGMFIAAGGFHMLGERGVPELLRRRGYTVERVWEAKGATASRDQRSSQQPRHAGP